MNTPSGVLYSDNHITRPPAALPIITTNPIIMEAVLIQYLLANIYTIDIHHSTNAVLEVKIFIGLLKLTAKERYYT